MTVSRRHFVRAGLAAAVLGLAGGCTRPSPVKGTYVLEPGMPPAGARTHPGLVRVGGFTVSAPYRGRSFVYRETDLKFETDYYHEFLVAPGANISDATARALAAAKVFAGVAPSGVPVDHDWVLDGFVDALYADGRVKDKPLAMLRITFFLRSIAGDAGVPVWTRTYERQVPFATGSAGAYVTALNTALTEILAELAKDLAGASLPKP